MGRGVEAYDPKGPEPGNSTMGIPETTYQSSQGRKRLEAYPEKKRNKDFWEAIAQAKNKHRPPIAPGMPLMEVKTEVNLSAKVQQFSAFQSCVDELIKNTAELKKRIALLEAQVPPEKVGEAHSKVPRRPHEEKIAFPT